MLNNNTPSSREFSFEEGFFNLNGTYIHPTSIVGKNVILDENVKVGPFCILSGKTEIASGSRLFSNVIVGLPGQDLNTKNMSGTVKIGKNCEIREFVSIHSPKEHFETNNNTTSIGDNCYIMNFSHIAHNAILENNVTLNNNVQLGGHVHVEHHATLMANSAVHQFCKIGAFCALAPYSGTRQDILPFGLFNGLPAKFFGLNRIALKRANFTSILIDAINYTTKLFFKDKLSLEKIIEQTKQEIWFQEKEIQYLLNFIKNSTRGISRRSIFDDKS